jgi:hypothetical protein
MNTTIATFNDAVLSASTTALYNFVLPTLSAWLQSVKNITITPTELAEALQLQSPTRNIVVGTATPVAIPATGGRVKANVGNVEVPAGQGCIRVPKNTGPADKRGIPCNKPRMDGKEYCSTCNFLKSGGNETKEPGKAKATKAGKTKETGLTTAPIQQQQQQQAQKQPPQEEPPVENVQVNAQVLSKFPGYYLEDVCRLLFKIAENGDYIYYAKLSPDQDKLSRLTVTDRMYCKELGMTEPTKTDEDREYEILTALCNAGLAYAGIPAPQPAQQTQVQPTQQTYTQPIPTPQQFTQQPAPQQYTPQAIPTPVQQYQQTTVQQYQQAPIQQFAQQPTYAPQNYAMPNTGVYNPNIPTFQPITNIATIPPVKF